jgi:uncharacterized protein YggU (UPF0235/DUF167 family)
MAVSSSESWPPVAEQANVAAASSFADHLGVRASSIEVVSGRHSRDKVLSIRRH